MNKQEVMATIGSPDYAATAETLDPPYRQKGSYWAYVLSMRVPKFIDPLTDQHLYIFFDLSGNAFWMVPSNIQGIAQKGNPSSNN
jgi:hypothetical protein